MLTFVRINLFSVMTMLLGVFCFTVALQYDGDSSAFPRAIAVFLLALTMVDLIRSARVQSPIEGISEGVSFPGNRKYLIPALLVFLSAPVYVFLAKLFDFEIATFIYLVLGMYSLGMRKPILIVAISIGVLIAVKGLFFVLLDVTRASTLIFGT
ncbi:MAG: hypothetical protein ACI9GW_000390 [Halieaceae bacterium]|jgi:hypothetical protein